MKTQDGTLAFIQNNIDYRQGTGKLAVNGSAASLKDNVSVASQMAIWKLSLTDGTNSIAAIAVTVKVGSTTVAAATSEAKSEYYLCLNPNTMGTGDFTIEAFSGSASYAYTKAGGVTLTAGKYYQSTVPMAMVVHPFTINSSGTKVLFAPGNLQATWDDTSWTWAFAAHQWDYIGNAPGNTSVNGIGTVSASNVTVDLFGWVGASSSWTDAAQYGISNATSGYGNGATESLKSDWGNTISDGFTWRTPTKEEWTYVFSTRTTGGTVFGTLSARYAHATINTDGNNVNGMILFPDDVDIASSEVTTAGKVNTSSSYDTKCTSAQWTALAAKGCVFLPAAGYRDGASVKQTITYGYYWSSSTSNRMYFTAGNMIPVGNDGRRYGLSVRLIREIDE